MGTKFDTQFRLSSILNVASIARGTRDAPSVPLAYPHLFRAIFAAQLDVAQVNLTVIQELMGHANIQTTARYVGIAGKEMRPAIETLT